jgi:hypothetical protein
MRLFLLILMVLIANVLAGPVLWVAVGIWGVAVLWIKFTGMFKRYKL